jgi:hypothetical protein
MTHARKFVALLFVVALLGVACGGDDGATESGAGEESAANQPDFATVQALVEEWASDPSKTDPKACPVRKVEEASAGGQKISCYDEEDLSIGLEAAIRWEFPDAAAAQEHIDNAGTSSEYYLLNENVVVDGPVGATDGMYDAQEFLTALSEKCSCGEVQKKP